MADKERERAFARDAAARLGWHPIEIIDRESPDFELVFEDQVIGLEVQETIDEGTARGQDGMDRLCRALEEELGRRGCHANVLLSFYWAAAELVTPTKARDAHVAALADLVAIRRPTCGDGSVTFSESDLEQAGATLVQDLHVWASEETMVTHAHHRPGPNYPFLDKLIRGKDALVHQYRANMQHALAGQWLLLVAGAHRAGTFLESIARRNVYPTRFDRVFFLDVQDKVAFEVKTTVRAA